MTKIPRSYRLNRELDAQLHKIARKEGKSRSGIVRDALTNYLKNPQK